MTRRKTRRREAHVRGVMKSKSRSNRAPTAKATGQPTINRDGAKKAKRIRH